MEQWPQQSFYLELQCTEHDTSRQQNTNRIEGGSREGPFIASGGLLPNPLLSTICTARRAQQCNYRDKYNGQAVSCHSLILSVSI